MTRTAIVRTPGRSLARGLTTSGLGPPDHDRALAQHEAYGRALAECGVEVVRLPADEDHPDSVFVEDVAVLTPRRAILTRPGAESRRGEVAAIRPALAARFGDLRVIEPPGTLDGGDVCLADGEALIGVSARTNESGARQLAAFLAEEGVRAASIDIRPIKGLLHLKSGLAWLGDGRMAAVPEVAGLPDLRRFRIIAVDPDERYAANCVPVNGRVLAAAGHPRFLETLAALGLPVIALDASEFRKMDGGLSCLSLRF